MSHCHQYYCTGVVVKKLKGVKEFQITQCEIEWSISRAVYKQFVLVIGKVQLAKYFPKKARKNVLVVNQGGVAALQLATRTAMLRSHKQRARSR